jgi:hypothetical protein
MHGEYRDEKDRSHRDAGESDQRSEEYRQASEDFDQNRRPGHNVRRRNADCLQDGCE